MSRKDLGDHPLIQGGSLAREAISLGLQFDMPPSLEESGKLIQVIDEICLHHGQAVGAITFLIQMNVLVLNEFVPDPKTFLEVMWMGMAESDMTELAEFEERMKKLRARIEEKIDVGGWDDQLMLDDDGEEE